MKSLLRFTVVLMVAACGGSADKPIVEVIPPPVVIPPTLVPGTSAALDAALNTALDVFPSVTVKDQNGAAVPNVWVKWTASSGKVDNDSSLTNTNGRANAGKWTLGTVSGLQTVTARTGGVSVVAMSAIVAPGPFAGFVAVSSSITGVVGSVVAVPASVKAVDAFGNGVPRILVQFSPWIGNSVLTGRTQTTDDNGVASVGSWQLGTTIGAQAIRADDGGRTGASVLVNATALPAPATQFVIIDGNAQNGQADRRLCTSPIIAVRDQFGNGVGQIPIVFTPGANSGTVTGGSVVSTNGSGYATLGAWTLSSSATQTLIVTSPSLPGVTTTFTATLAPSANYSVCVRYVGNAGTPRQRQAVTTAVQRWQRVIVGHVQSSPLNEPANSCFPGSPAINEVVEDLLVYVRITTLDGPGNVVARANPCTLHMPAGLTALGTLQIDSVDTDLLLAQGILDNTITHELGHIIGVGTLWTQRSLLSGAGSDDPFFTGVSARAQFAQLFPSYTGNTVPVENTGDPGTRDAHWRHSVFNNEIMQGFFVANMPLSRVTVGSLGDLGYTVDLTKADPLTTVLASHATPSRGLELVSDIARAEIWGVEKNGNRFVIRSASTPSK